MVRGQFDQFVHARGLDDRVIVLGVNTRSCGLFLLASAPPRYHFTNLSRTSRINFLTLMSPDRVIVQPLVLAKIEDAQHDHRWAGRL